MRLIYIFLFVIIFPSLVIASKDEPTKDDYSMANRYGFTRLQVLSEYKKKKQIIDIERLTKGIEKKLSGSNFDRAELIDDALDNMIEKIVTVLMAEGRLELAVDIGNEYFSYYEKAMTKKLLGFDEIGDHAPLSQWLDSVHHRIHEALGDFICQYFRFHDIFILNHGIPVIFKPNLYDLKDYKDHFAGHLIWGFWWEHHGVAGVVTYWLVDGACIAGSYGLGVIVFICTPIATLAQNIVDKRIAPPIAERIWHRSQHED